MARATERLTARTVQTAKPPSQHAKFLADGRGLYLRIAAAGTKSWIYRYADGGRLHDMGLGSYPDISLSKARERAAVQRKLRLDGADPIAARKAARLAAKLAAAKMMTFRECAEAYVAAHRVDWRNPKHAAQWPSTLATYVYPIFGNLPVATVDVTLVTKAIEPIWATKRETAIRVRGRIESVLDWAKTRGYRQGENPARWKRHLENLLPRGRRVKHHAALPYAGLPAFMIELRQQNGVAARALEFAILTAARTGEVIGAASAEIDFKARVWIVPAQRMKAGREHRVPLSEAALAILRPLHGARDGNLIFPISNMAMLMLLRRMGRGDLTVHGFRSTFSDWCSECTNFPAEVREMALAHTVSDKVEAAYRRGDLFEKRRQLANAWANFVTALPDGKVVPMSAAR